MVFIVCFRYLFLTLLGNTSCLNYEALITKSNNKIEFDFQSVLEKKPAFFILWYKIVKRAFFKQHSKAINCVTSLLAGIIISKFICHYRIT